jgi:hypothetical protein
MKELTKISNSIYGSILFKKELYRYNSDILDISDNIRKELNERY